MSGSKPTLSRPQKGATETIVAKNLTADQKAYAKKDAVIEHKEKVPYRYKKIGENMPAGDHGRDVFQCGTDYYTTGGPDAVPVGSVNDQIDVTDKRHDRPASPNSGPYIGGEQLSNAWAASNYSRPGRRSGAVNAGEKDIDSPRSVTVSDSRERSAGRHEEKDSRQGEATHDKVRINGGFKSEPVDTSNHAKNRTELVPIDKRSGAGDDHRYVSNTSSFGGKPWKK